MFERNAHAYDIQSQAKLYEATVVVIGCGGGGGVIAELLARTGIGRLVLIDGDIYEESNLNRQIGATIETLGKTKVKVLKNRLEKINPYLEVRIVNDFLSEDNYRDIFSEILPLGKVIVSDTADGIENKRLISNICKIYSLPLVTGGNGVYKSWIGTYKNAAEKNAESLLKNIDQQVRYSSPSLVWIQAAMQSQEIINNILDRDWGANNRVIYYDNMTYSIFVKDIKKDDSNEL